MSGYLFFDDEMEIQRFKTGRDVLLIKDGKGISTRYYVNDVAIEIMSLIDGSFCRIDS